MRINHNIAALNTYRQLTGVNNATSKALEKLSSGYRINRAGDDAAGLAISEKMRGQIRGLEMASKNAQDGISLIQTAEGALNEVHSILQRMRELAVQSASDTNTGADRAELQKEVDELAKELTRIANNTEFNTQILLNGAVKSGNVGVLTFHIGANANQNLTLDINAMDAYSLGVARDISITTGTPSGDNISNVSFEGTLGSAIVDGATITFTAADNTGAEAEGTLDIGGTTGVITASFGAAGDEGNGIRIVFGADNDGALAASWDAGTRTVTVQGDWDNSGGGGAPTLANIQTAIQGADALLGNVTLSVDGTFTASELDDAGEIVLAGGADANPAETILTVSDGTTSQNVVLQDSDTRVSITSGAFAGISFDVVDVTALSGDSIAIAQTIVTSSAAVFVDGQKTADAVAAAGIDISTQSAADAAITKINDAIEVVSAERSKLGAYQNRLEHTINNLGTSAENLTAAESRIRDVDMAKEIMEFTKNNIISQAATAMLAQANMMPQQVLQLLQ